MLGNLRMEINMVKEQKFGPVEKSMLGSSRMEKGMVKEPPLFLMEQSMLGDTRMVNIGTYKLLDLVL